MAEPTETLLAALSANLKVGRKVLYLAAMSAQKMVDSLVVLKALMMAVKMAVQSGI